MKDLYPNYMPEFENFGNFQEDDENELVIIEDDIKNINILNIDNI